MDTDSVIKAGWGSADITPRGGKISLVGQWEVRVTDVIKDPIYANAMVLQSNGRRVIWVACDLCVISQSLSDEVKRLLYKSLPGFTGDELILSATHIHTGPNTNTNPFTTLLDDRGDPPDTIPSAECCRQAAVGIEAAVLQAVSSLKPSRFDFAVSYTITGVSRRVSYMDGTGAMYGDIKKPEFMGMEGRDGGPIQILYARDIVSGVLTGVIAAVPCTAQADEMGLYVTADYWAAARDVIKKNLGEDVCVLGLIRSAGDLSPHTMVDGGALIEQLYGATGAVDMGRRIGGAVVKSADDILRSYSLDTVFKHVSVTTPLPLWTCCEQGYEEAKAYKQSIGTAGLGPLNDMMAYSTALAKIKRYESGQTEYPANFHALRIGDVVFITNPFEMYIEYADRIRAACPEAQVIDVQLAGDDCLGYMPTQKAIEAGGYSTKIFSCFSDADGGEKTVSLSVALIKDMFRY